MRTRSIAMKITSFSFGDNGINKIRGVKTPKVQHQKNGEIVDSVKMNGTVKSMEQTSLVLYEAEIDLPPRIELIRTVSERISSGSYNSGELLENIAENVIDSSPVQDMINEVAFERAYIQEERTEKIDRVNYNAVKEYYNTNEVKEKIAGSIIETLGLEYLSGNSK